MNARQRLLVATVAALSAASALADPHMRPGLWEESVTIKSDNPQANAGADRLASLPPAQRAMVEKMMASRGMGAAAGKPNVHRVCVSKEQSERGFRPEDSGRCSRANISTSGNVTSFDFACKSEHGDISGHGKFTAISDSAYTVDTQADSVSPNGTMHVQTSMAGKYVSADCGAVKPTGVPAH